MRPVKKYEAQIDPLDARVRRRFVSLIRHSPSLPPEMFSVALTDFLIFEIEGLLEVEEKSFNLDFCESPGAANSRTF
jgi:hypothetical protein